MNCVLFDPSFCGAKYLVDGLTAWSWVAVTQAALGAFVGAALAFAFNWILHLARLKAEEARINEQQREAQNRDNRAAVVEVIRYASPERVNAWVREDRYTHVLADHPERLNAEFPNGWPGSGSLIEAKLALAAPQLISTGPIHELILALRLELNRSRYSEKASSMTDAFSAFIPVAMVFLENGEDVDLDRFKKLIERKSASTRRACAQCEPPLD